MDLWSWAVSVYGRPGVAEAALALQDDHGQCVPLRVARRGLKAELAGVEAPAREALRARVKAAELESERLLLSALADLDGGGQAPLEAALAAVATAWGGIADPAALDQLSRALSGPLPDPGKTG